MDGVQCRNCTVFVGMLEIMSLNRWLQRIGEDAEPRFAAADALRPLCRRPSNSRSDHWHGPGHKARNGRERQMGWCSNVTCPTGSWDLPGTGLEAL